ncbi:MAG TPA: methionine--tRNA ligase subunit beta [Candidatus Pacearchaeota archaeon]|jgi:methionine--tRNA ligase beta chain|nr:methionine--tRNA ligase subunit beta [Candidatus Pacearchaeota archaeon]HQG09324.1 methionine--tRNA ligase subunit beta [Candidatus Pacearchaeota archaeon]HQH20202.1 methionine--tRNA ligase subunit beta [Candidatus Pacearchaeota archaeon]HQK58538.1 methionine--tRNA ligase subunit beta [Candidatus Pacearchaeota archaeon]
MITFEDFEKIDLRLAKIIAAEKIDGSDKLLKIKAQIGNEERQIIAGIGKFYTPENLIDKIIVIVFNLEPRMIMGLESQAMLLAVKDNNELSLIVPDKIMPSGLQLS